MKRHWCCFICDCASIVGVGQCMSQRSGLCWEPWRYCEWWHGDSLMSTVNYPLIIDWSQMENCVVFIYIVFLTWEKNLKRRMCWLWIQLLTIQSEMNKVTSFFGGFIFWRADDATCGTSTWIGKGLTCYCFKRKGNYERICVTLTPAQVNE